MAYVICEPCIGSKDRSCVEVCPVDCFYNYPNPELNQQVNREPSKPGDFGMLVIHPDECIHCGACESECPVGAIFEEDDVPEKWQSYIRLNAEAVENCTSEELDERRVTSRE